MKTETENLCELCGRTKKLTFHHLIPKTCHSNKWFKKNFTTADMKTRGIYVCQHCHDFIHSQYSEKELGKSYNTKEILLQNSKIKEFIRWVRKQTKQRKFAKT
jgi:5-methylcytosine-specific restriction endonuclease McrA